MLCSQDQNEEYCELYAPSLTLTYLLPVVDGRAPDTCSECCLSEMVYINRKY